MKGNFQISRRSFLKASGGAAGLAFLAGCVAPQPGAAGGQAGGATTAKTTVNFQTNGVSPNQVVQLTAPKSQYPGGGVLLAIDSVNGSSLTLRRLHKDLSIGQPPAPAAG